MAVPAAVRFLSMGPLLGPVILDDMCDGWKFPDALRGNWWHDSEPPRIERGKPKIDLVIVGGESGKDARPMHPDWVRSLREQCNAADAAFFFKQWGEWGPVRTTGHRDPRYPADPPPSEHMERFGKKAAGRLLGGRTWDQMPGGVHA